MQSTKQPQPQNQRGQRTQKCKKEGKKGRCWDWILIGGNTHYARNRTSFLTYRRLPTKISNSRVLGIGTVRLKVRRGPGAPGNKPNTLILHDVLHMPDARCNGISLSRFRESHPLEGVEGEREFYQATDPEGGMLWYAEEYCGLSKVVLWGNPVGETYLRHGRAYLLSVFASGEEMERLYEKVREKDLVS